MATKKDTTQVGEKVGLIGKITAIIEAILPLFTDTNSAGKRKVSIGRSPLLIALAIMLFWYAKTGTGPDSGILSFIGMAMAYNGFSKTSIAQGSGGE